MIPAMCRVKHDPPHSYGDCVRACIASMLEWDVEAVPHFYLDGCDGEIGNGRIADFLKTIGYAPAFTSYDGSYTLGEILEFVGANTHGAHYMLYGSTADGGNHVVVCKGAEVVHNPAWYWSSIKKPTVEGFWFTMVIARL